jgi:4,5-dihydroxyphthalate decarboxylase
MFRHGFIFVNRRCGIVRAQDLAGKRIGLQGYQMTAAVWIRGLLREDYGVDLGAVEWLEGGVNQRGVAGGSTTRLRPERPVDIHPIGSERTLSDLLVAGEIDALIGAHVPASLRGHPDVVRLFPDYHAVERDYFRRTGIFPIMHALVIRDGLHRVHPWLVRRIYDACEAAKSAALQRLRFTAALRVTLPWMLEQVEELDDVFGGDPWPYGVDANRRTLEAFARYLVEDGFSDRILPIEDVFVPITG